MQTVEEDDFASVLHTALYEGWGHPEGVQWTQASLAAHVRVSTMTVRRWARGQTTPYYRTLIDCLDLWAVTPSQRKRLLQARDRSDPKREPPPAPLQPPTAVAEVAVVESDGGNEDMKRRDVLYSAGALVVSPMAGLSVFEDLSDLAHAAERYNAITQLAEIVGTRCTIEQRLVAAKRLESVCIQACSKQPNTTNHLLASMAGSMRAIAENIIDSNSPKAVEAAKRARQHAAHSGQNVAKLWAATAEASSYQKANSPQAAVSVLEGVMHLKAERGTMPVFAASILAEAYGALGDVENTHRAIRLAQTERNQVQVDDEFGGLMAFPIEQEMVHVAHALLRAGENADAIQFAARALAEYERMPVEERRAGYMQSACLAIATAATRLGWFDKAEAYAQRAMQFPTTTLKLNHEFHLLRATVQAHASPLSLRRTIEQVVAV